MIEAVIGEAAAAPLAGSKAPTRLAVVGMFIELVKPRIMVMALLTAAGAMRLALGSPMWRWPCGCLQGLR